jgi:hypothetical protein
MTSGAVAVRPVTDVGPSKRAEIRDFGYFLRTKRSHPRRPVYAAFNTRSWRSHLSLTRSFRLFWPHRLVPLPTWEAGLYAVCVPPAALLVIYASLLALFRAPETFQKGEK